jgi:hypothetical protein
VRGARRLSAEGDAEMIAPVCSAANNPYVRYAQFAVLRGSPFRARTHKHAVPKFRHERHRDLIALGAMDLRMTVSHLGSVIERHRASPRPRHANDHATHAGSSVAIGIALDGKPNAGEPFELPRAMFLIEYDLREGSKSCINLLVGIATGGILAGANRSCLRLIGLRPRQRRPDSTWGGCSRGARTLRGGVVSQRPLIHGVGPNVRRGKVLVFSGCNSHPATGSLQPVAIGAAVEVTKPSEPSRRTGRMAIRRADRL